MGVHKSLSSYQPDQPIKPWVSAIIRYKLADHFRKLSKRREDFIGENDLPVTIPAEDTNNALEGSVRVQEVSVVLSQLPDKLRQALEMTHIEGLSYADAANQAGVSEVALRKRISRAFVKVKKEVERNLEISIE